MSPATARSALAVLARGSARRASRSQLHAERARPPASSPCSVRAAAEDLAQTCCRIAGRRQLEADTSRALHVRFEARALPSEPSCERAAEARVVRWQRIAALTVGHR